MPNADTRNRWRFFLEHAGYATPPGRAACALELARAEILLDEAEGLEVATFELVDDDTPYDPGDFVTEDEAAQRFESGEWSGPFGAILKVGIEAGEPMPVNDPEYASLWGIVLATGGAYRPSEDPYLRVIRAELASELLDELRQAIGDARDELEDDSDATPAERVWPLAGVSR